MENLAHSFVGIVIGKAGFERHTAYSVPLCVVAANLPDADFVATLGGEWFYLHHHRGITHSIVGVLTLAVLLAALFHLFGKWREKRQSENKHSEHRREDLRELNTLNANQVASAVNFKYLLLASLIACLSHPVLDWTNNYGVRPLLPFDARWFYGDLVFIIDPYIWLSIGGAAFLLTANTKLKSSIWMLLGLLMTAAILILPARSGFDYPRSSQLLWLLGLAGLFIAYRYKLAARYRSRLAMFALINLIAYYFLLGAIHHRAVAQGVETLSRIAVNENVNRFAATPTLANPLKWQCLADTGANTYRFDLNLNDAGSTPRNLTRFAKPTDATEQLAINRAAGDARAQVLLDFARFPVARVSRNCIGETLIQFADLRYTEPGTKGRGNFNLEVELPRD